MKTLETLTLEEKIGQMLCLGWQGDDSCLRINEQAKRCVQELHAGGMILFARNVQESGTLKPLVNAVKVKAMLDELQSLAETPLFTAIDQEGGRVARLGSPFTPFPAAKVVGDAGSVELAENAAWAAGEELSAVGINFNFAPVADINSNPANPVIGERSFGGSPAVVSEMVVAQVKGYARGGVLSCAKHFPGHGDTDTDSHHALPALPHPREVIQERELAPFQSAIQNGIPAIMTAHILFPALDNSGVPATMSHGILTELLRGELGFQGLIVTDCLQMKAVSETWGTAKAAVMAAQAGADILLVCHTWERQKEAFDALVAAARSGELSETRIDEAVGRILTAKANLPGTDCIPSLSVIGAADHVQIARAICDRADVPFTEPTSAPTLGEKAY